MDSFPDAWMIENSPLSPAKMHAVGVIALSWGMSDFWLGVLFGLMTGAPQRPAQAIVKVMSPRQTWETILAIAEHQGSGQLAHLKRMKADYDAHSVLRNRYVHAAFADISPGGEELSLVSRRGRELDTHEIPNDLASIRKVADDIKAFNKRFETLCMETWQAKSSPVRPRAKTP